MYLTYLIITITVLISLKAFEDENLMRKMILNPYAVIQQKKWYKLITHGFVLYMFGVEITPSSQVFYHGFKSLEPALVYDFGWLGYVWYAILYFGGIVAATIPSLIKHKNNPNYNSLGASGAVSAVVFASIILNPTAQMGLLFLPFYLPAYIFGPLMLLAEYFLSKRGRTNIAHDAHIAGAVFGLVFICIINPNYLSQFLQHIF